MSPVEEGNKLNKASKAEGDDGGRKEARNSEGDLMSVEEL